MKNKTKAVPKPPTKLIGGYIDKSIHDYLVLYSMANCQSKTELLKIAIHKLMESIKDTPIKLLSMIEKDIKRKWYLKKQYKLYTSNPKELAAEFLLFKKEQRQILVKKGLLDKFIDIVMKKIINEKKNN
jgi:hypothetical protein